MEQHGRRQHFEVTTLLMLDQFRVAPDTHNMGEIVRSVFFVRGDIQEICRKPIERMEDL
jgi:hypothetical protein